MGGLDRKPAGGIFYRAGTEKASEYGDPTASEYGYAKLHNAEEKANPLKLMVFLFFWLFNQLIIGIFYCVRFIISIPTQCISHILISPFKKELRLQGKIYEHFKKFEIYNEDSRFVLSLYKNFLLFLGRGNRFFYVSHDECKKTGLRNLIDIVDDNYKDEIHRRAIIDYEKAKGKKQSIFKQGLAFIFFALTFVACLPFIVVSHALTGAEKVLTFLPEKIVEKTVLFKKEKTAFYKIWDKIIIGLNPSSVMGSPHAKFVFEKLKMIDDLAAIKTKKMLKNSGLDEDEIEPSAYTELNPVDEAELYDASKLEGLYNASKLEEADKDDLVGEYLAKVEAFPLYNGEISRRLDAVIAVDDSHNSCNRDHCNAELNAELVAFWSR